MSDRCEPPPELRSVDGWHWVEYPSGFQDVKRWWLSHQEWEWQNTSRDVAQMIVYLSPAATPAEVEALRAERDALAADKRAAQAFQTHNARLVRNRDAELITLRARVAELEGALQKIADDGVECVGRYETEAIRAYARAALSAETP